jgi:hypothetical protein
MQYCVTSLVSSYRTVRAKLVIRGGRAVPQTGHDGQFVRAQAIRLVNPEPDAMTFPFSELKGKM